MSERRQLWFESADRDNYRRHANLLNFLFPWSNCVLFRRLEKEVSRSSVKVNIMWFDLSVGLLIPVTL